MIIYPALDLRNGQVVRLREGDPDQQTVFSPDPVETASRWIREGAEWLHVVNLDGAFTEANDNLNVLRDISALGCGVQFGGGLRSFEDATAAIEAGATRIILGTAAIRTPELVTQAIDAWSADRVCVALDARGGKVAIDGWKSVSDLSPSQLGAEMAARGVRHALYTDVSRDGKLAGVNVDSTVALAVETGLHVIASGGVNSITDITALASQGVAGAIIGMALYEGRLTLADALVAARKG